jgi:hypothetical protein
VSISASYHITHPIHSKVDENANTLFKYKSIAMVDRLHIRARSVRKYLQHVMDVTSFVHDAAQLRSSLPAYILFYNILGTPLIPSLSAFMRISDVDFHDGM